MEKDMKKIIATVFIWLAAPLVTANADIIIYDYLQGGSGDVQNVLFNDANSSDVGLTVDGYLNQTGEVVNFTGTELLKTPSGGQARIEAVDGAFTEIFFALADTALGFNKVQFNIDATGDGMVNLTFVDQFDVSWTGSSPYSVSGNGQNWFTAVGINGQVIKSVQITSTVELTSLADLQQVRLNPTPIGAVPEPAAMLLFGAGLAGLAMVGRRRKG